MKIYDFVGAPNPKKVRVYLAEKGISIPFEPVNIVTGENRLHPQPSIADCTLLAALEFAEFAQVAIDPAHTYSNVVRWYAAYRQRPSAQA